MMRHGGTLALILAVGLLWAMESVMGKVVLSHGYSAFDFPIVLNAATIVACAFAFLLRRDRPGAVKVTRRGLVAQVWVALSLVVVPYFVIYLSLRALSPADTSLISSMTPMFSLFLSAAWRRKRIRLGSLCCVIAGFIGVAMLIYPGLTDPGQAGQAIWYLVMLAAPASYALSGFATRRTGQLDVSYRQTLFVTNTVSLAFFLAANGGLTVPARTTSGDIVAIFVGVFCNILSVVIVLFLSRRISPFSLSLANYATVLFAFILSVAYLHESMGVPAVAGGFLIVASSLLLVRRNDGAGQGKP